ncbi:uncharacterized protein A1O9_09458 [Exophiala aquamarina CBS 119918]|uniref:Protein kinase domain-containing protein n=1 Tax=Exophiala aquamarina CBS 119918 TaxID=1182545 RepID=A0A072P3N9_9EURO|nr:uncharacterized protein A1O9_09458 [Exophiala aquamarina CBS 119918]KEF54292.1 hypothetical protein A1O9_09458 [Exophiala aquamarina CBS 119918]
MTLPPSIPSTCLQPIIQPGSYFLPSTRLVCHESREYVAKGPIYSTRIYYDYQEIRNLVILPPHPNIIPPPCALVTVSDIDERVCGFLAPHYRNGNLDIYARRLRSKGTITVEKLYKWLGQLVDAVRFLAEKETWHGDIKPDNIVIDDDENAVLIDLARAFTTSATTSPEARKYISTHAPCRTSVGIPEDWPLQIVVLSEIYSIGRTMYLSAATVAVITVVANVAASADIKFWFT